MTACVSLASIADDRRTCGRLLTEQLETEVGRVVNLSASGMRVSTRSSLKARVGETIDIRLGEPEHATTVKGKIVWARRAGFRRHLAGICFLELGTDERSRLTRLAQNAVFLPGLGNQNVSRTHPRAA
jgi:hypothetical protein